MISETEYQTLCDNVARGAALLDHQTPDWAQDIRPERLEMQLCSRCILGQLFHGDFTRGCNNLGIEGEAVGMHGFDLEDKLMHAARSSDIDELWTLLDALWTDEVKRRTS